LRLGSKGNYNFSAAKVSMQNKLHKKIVLLCSLFVVVAGLVIISTSSQLISYIDYLNLSDNQSAEVIATDSYPGVLVNFFAFLTRLLPSFVLNKVEFTEFPQINTRESFKATTYIRTIVIYTDSLEPIKCPSESYAFEYFVLFTNKDSIIQESCSAGYSQSNTYEYLSSIGKDMNQQKGLPLFTASDLQNVTVYIGRSTASTNLNGN